jgi:hypothetical protein
MGLERQGWLRRFSFKGIFYCVVERAFLQGVLGKMRVFNVVF